MGFLKSDKPDPHYVTFGPHATDFVACSDTPLLGEMCRLLQLLRDSVSELQAAKTLVGLLRGKLPKENQKRETASETSVFGVEAVNRHYAFAVARAQYQLAIMHVQQARTELGKFLSEHLVQEPNPL